VTSKIMLAKRTCDGITDVPECQSHDLDPKCSTEEVEVVTDKSCVCNEEYCRCLELWCEHEHEPIMDISMDKSNDKPVSDNVTDNVEDMGWRQLLSKEAGFDVSFMPEDEAFDLLEALSIDGLLTCRIMALMKDELLHLE